MILPQFAVVGGDSKEWGQGDVGRTAGGHHHGTRTRYRMMVWKRILYISNLNVQAGEVQRQLISIDVNVNLTIFLTN